MESTARRAFRLLRQHFLLLGGPWLVVCAVGIIVTTTVRQLMNRLYPLVNLRTMSAAGYAAQDAAASNNMINNFIRMVAIDSTLILENAFKVIALALTILMVKTARHEGRGYGFRCVATLGKDSVRGRYFAEILRNCTFVGACDEPCCGSACNPL